MTAATVRRTRVLKTGGENRSHILVEKKRASNQAWEKILENESLGENSLVIGDQVTDSENHNWPSGSRNQNGSADIGGNFYTKARTGDVTITTQATQWEKPLSGTYDRERVHIVNDLSCPIERYSNGKPIFPTVSQTPDSDLNAMGATAISRVAPTSSAVELGVALGEVRKDGLPHLLGHTTWREKTLKAKNAGDEFLNYEFGWLPLMADVTNFGSTVIKSADILKQYRADRGKTIRRTYTFPVETTTSEVTLSTLKRPDGLNADRSGPGASLKGTWTKSTTTKTSRWFSGAFMYGVPGSFASSKVGQLGAEADKLFGLSLTPDLLWNLAPWSWAVDWFTNTGDVLENVSDMVAQGLVMRYGYLMETKSISVTYKLHGCTFHGTPVVLAPAVLETVSKVRVRANPFGFGITWDGLSPIQIAILAALGISRS